MRLALIILALCRSAVAQTIPPDYRLYLDALDAQLAGRHEDALRGLDALQQTVPVSPLNGRAAIAAARSSMTLQRPGDAVASLRAQYDALPQPEGDLLLGQASEAAGNLASAAAWYQQVYFRFPLSKDAPEAENAIARLRIALGPGFPPALPKSVLDRAEIVRKAGMTAQARTELLAAAAQFHGPERELALVRANFYDYQALAVIRVENSAIDAERIYLMHAAARRNGNAPQAEAALNQLRKKYPRTSWTMEALISWGNHFLLRNQPVSYLPLYRECYLRFPADPQAAYCHWKVLWSAWMRREPGARKLMAEHADRFPQGEKASAALYFAGRYQDVVTRWPMSYYAVLARQKYKALPVVIRPDPANFKPSTINSLRLSRGKQLEQAGLTEWAEFELKYAAVEQPYVAAMALAELATGRGAHDQALRYIKSLAKGYLSLPYQAAPERFWRLAFPLPYKQEVIDNCQKADLQTHMVAALIRQESEFNPLALSRANAYGLTQVMPATGFQLSRQLGITQFQTAMLYEPDVNLRLGTHYLKSLLSAHSGQWEKALASYNAGKRRTDLWSTWHKYREPAEFIECIPFTETRNYVQVVLRNADMYRRLYGTP